ncbi:transposase [Pediococcus pentosaceus]|nr:transposase [Pediococcus pentosaceus]
MNRLSKGRNFYVPTRYDKEFKQNIIKLYKQGESAAQLAREYGIGYSTVHKWIQGQAKTQSGKSPDEIKAMEKRLASLSEENEILKKPWASLRRSNQYL